MVTETCFILKFNLFFNIRRISMNAETTFILKFSSFTA